MIIDQSVQSLSMPINIIVILRNTASKKGVVDELVLLRIHTTGVFNFS